MKNTIKIFTLMACICFTAKNGHAQSKPLVAVKTGNAKSAVAVKKVTSDSTAKKTTIPDPIAAITRQGVEVTKPAATVAVKLPPVSDQEAKAKKE